MGKMKKKDTTFRQKQLSSCFQNQQTNDNIMFSNKTEQKI